MIMAVSDEHGAEAQVTASVDGRVTIPATVRRAAGIEPGQRLVAYVENGRVVLEEWNHLLRRVQQRVAASTTGHAGSVVDDLIADRRHEAARDEDSPNATVRDTIGPGAA